MTLEALIRNTIAPLLADRVFPIRAPADIARPYCIVTPVSNTPTYTQSGPVNSDFRVVQVDLYSDAGASYDDAEALAVRIRFALEKAGFRMSNEGRADEPDVNLRRARMDFKFRHKPT
jgi:hypothetical protein